MMNIELQKYKIKDGHTKKCLCIELIENTSYLLVDIYNFCIFRFLHKAHLGLQKTHRSHSLNVNKINYVEYLN